METEELVDGLLASIQLSENLSDEVKAWFEDKKESLRLMLDCESVRLPAKALHLSTDYGQLFISANVVTDIRPVFDGDRDIVQGAIINQTLRLHYIDGRSRNGRVEEELSLALDIDDIDKLIEELKKAKIKADASKSFVEASAGVEVFAVGEETYGFG